MTPASLPPPSPTPPPEPVRSGGKWQTILLRAGLFALMVVLGLLVFAAPLQFLGGYFVAATLTTFLTGLVANVLSVRIYEKFSPLDLGIRWNAASRRHALLGFGIGGLAALCVVALLLVTGGASIARVGPVSLPSLLFVAILLAAGAAGEELLFRGYGFQFLGSQIGDYAALLPISVLFGIMHSGNQGMTNLALANTMAWGAALGYAFLRSRDLWLPFGIHFAWNLVLPLFGGQLSGFTMSVTGLQLTPNPASGWSGGNYGPEGSVLTTVAVLAVIWYLRNAPIEAQASAFAPEPEPGDWPGVDAPQGGEQS